MGDNENNAAVLLVGKEDVIDRICPQAKVTGENETLHCFTSTLHLNGI